VRIAPAFAEMLANITGPFLIDPANARLDVGSRLEAGPQPLHAFTERRVNKHAKDIRPVLQQALRAAAHNHAVAPNVGFFNDLAGKLVHQLGVEEVLFAQWPAGG